MRANFLLLLILFCTSLSAVGQGFLHTSGKYINDGNNEEFIIRGLGTGNWMLQEGYMMQTSDIGGTQHEFRAKLEETIGVAKTDSFYNAWLQYHFTKTDVDSMASWGYNTVRVAMHYKWFTPPIEEEPVEGEITWLSNGFTLLDSLLGWCAQNEMYLILDLHGAPGGQGKDANISDYDPSKPSLWESELNKEKTVALWKKLAERYADEPWIGGYDLINETNWTFPEGNNSQMRELYGRITDAIRAVDQNHIIFIEGNSFANDFSGLTPPWDDNMVYSFHKYWNYNTKGSIQWVLDLRETYEIPIWLGETGENSNTWFTNLVKLCENNNIGWSWWPVKKPGINNPLRVSVNEDYTRLINYWKGEGAAMTEEEAFQAVLQFAENHKIENCIYQKNVVDAMIRQPHTTETIPFKEHITNEKIFFSDFDLGRVGYAYYDNDTANYHLDQNGEYTNWNQGWSYRNDGVDIETCSDLPEHTNGYNVGWTENGEWLQYTIDVDQKSAWQLKIRYATTNESRIQLEVEGIPLTSILTLSATGGNQSWETFIVDDVVVPQGDIKVRCVIKQGGANLNFFSFENPVPIENVDFSCISAETVFPGNALRLFLNKPVTMDINSDEINDFNVSADGDAISIKDVHFDASFPRQIVVSLDSYIKNDQIVMVSYSGQNIISDGEGLPAFELEVPNGLPRFFQLPGTIQAEDFRVNNGFQLEDCQDQGGGFNTAFANPGDYVEYLVEVDEPGAFRVEYRVATERTSPKLVFFQEKEGEMVPLDTVTFQSTNGWQEWETQYGQVTLDSGRYKIRLTTLVSEYNLNWFKLSVGASVNNIDHLNDLVLYPNPARARLKVDFPYQGNGNMLFIAYDVAGNVVKSWKRKPGRKFELMLDGFSSGIYILKILEGNRVMSEKFLVSDLN
jgi:endoglucanase